jgi:putative transposase
VVRVREENIKQGYRSLDVARDTAMPVVSNLRELAPLNLVCDLFDMKRSSYYARCQSSRVIDKERVVMRAAVSEKHRISRGSAGSRSIVAMRATDGIQIGRFKVSRLMKEAQLVSKQPSAHKCKVALDERLEIPNTLDENNPSGHIWTRRLNQRTYSFQNIFSLL